MPPIPSDAGSTGNTNVAWIDAVDALLSQAEAVIGFVGADVAPLAARVALCVDIVALRSRLAGERAMFVEHGKAESAGSNPDGRPAP
jgi:hypothetical protein